MSKLIRALVTPSVLSWARESLHFSAEAAAKKVHVSPELISAWETGLAQPTIRQGRHLAELYRQQFAVFYLPQPPALKIAIPRDYRRMAGTSLEGPSPAILLDVQESWRRREVILELAEKNLPPGRLPRAAIRIESDPESSAMSVRSLLSIDINEQFKWRDNRVAFNGWRQSVEKGWKGGNGGNSSAIFPPGIKVDGKNSAFPSFRSSSCHPHRL
jgi:transcriptional regulator with XRE-family HTH domain